jgi:hypothetical protein
MTELETLVIGCVDEYGDQISHGMHGSLKLLEGLFHACGSKVVRNNTLTFCGGGLQAMLGFLSPRMVASIYGLRAMLDT